MKISYLSTIIKVLFSLAIALNANAQIHRVPDDFLTIQMGLDSAQFGDTVLVAPGTYFEHIVWPAVNGIKLIAEGDTTNTFIDGNYEDRVIHIKGHVIDTLTQISGFTIKRGSGNGSFSGSGIFCDSSGVNISNCRITENRGRNGAGICFWNSTAILENSTSDLNFYSENSTSGGTGIGVSENSNVVIRESKIVNNDGGVCWKVFGVGIAIQDSELRMYDSEVSFNTASFGEGGESRGVGIFSMSSKLYLFDCTIRGNLSLTPVEYNRGTAVNIESATLVHFENVRISENQAEIATELNSGIVAINSSNTTFRNVSIHDNVLNCSSTLFNDNHGHLMVNGNFLGVDLKIQNNQILGDQTMIEMHGVAIYSHNGNFHLENALITDNLVSMNHSDNSYQGVISFGGNGNKTIINSTIADNFGVVAGSAPLIVIDAAISKVSISNSIMWNNNALTEVVGDSISIAYSNIKGGYSGIGNIDADPMFVDDNDYHLMFLSPCINSGTTDAAPLADLDGNSRPMPIGTNPDMGAYEDDNPATSIGEITESIGAIVYPNPSNGSIQLSTQFQVRKINMFDAQGSLVMDRVLGNATILDISMLPSGIYMMHFQLMDERIITEKLIVLN